MSLHQKTASMSTKDGLGIKLKSDFERFYNIKGWCDALDYTGAWRLGRIKKADDNYILVHFDGWSEKWKQWYCKHSPTIAPLRTHTSGYTGQTSVALRDFDFQQEIIQSSERKLKLLLHDDKLSGFDAFRLTSFVRGDLFVLIDSILTLNDRIEAQECHQLSSFMKFYINMVLKWMNLAVPTYQAVRRELRIDNLYYLEDIQNKKLHVISKDISLYMCGIEIFISLKSILGLEARSSIFYEKNTLTLNSKDLINHFLSNQGLQKLNELLAYEDKDIPQGRIDFMLLWPLIYSIPFIFNKVTWTPWEKPIQKFIEIMYMRLKKEFEYDRQFKNKLEKTAEFVDFIHALEKLNSYVNEGGFLLDTLFDHGLDFEDDGGIDLSEVEFPDNVGRPTTVVHPGNDDQDSVVITEDESISKPAKMPSVEISQIQLLENQEANKIKEEILAMQKQMLEMKKGLDSMMKNQEDFKNSAAKAKEDKERLERRSIQPKAKPSEPKSEFLDSIKRSGISPQDLSVYLGYFKQINQTIKNEKKNGEKNGKARPEFEEHRVEDNGVSLGTVDDELKVLTALEMNLANNKLSDALKMIKWRKKVIKLAHMSGWDVATTVANKTVNKLDIDATDILTSNVNFLSRTHGTRFIENDIEDEEEGEEEPDNEIVVEKYEPSEGDAKEEEEEYYDDRISQQREIVRESTIPRYAEVANEIKEEESDAGSENNEAYSPILNEQK